MISTFENTLLKTPQNPDIMEVELLSSKLKILKNNPKGYKEFSETLDKDERLLEILAKPLENAILKIITSGEKSQNSAFLLQIYASKYLKLDTQITGNIDGIYGNKTANLEKIIFDKLSKTRENGEKKEIKENPEELKELLLKEKVLEKIGNFVVLNDEILSICIKEKNPDFKNTKYEKIGDKISSLLQSPLGKQILTGSIKIKNLDTYSTQFYLNKGNANKGNIDKILKSFETQDKQLVEIEKLTYKLDNDIKSAVRGSLPGSKINIMGCHDSNIPYKANVEKLVANYNSEVSNVFKKSIKEYLKTLLSIEPRSDILKQDYIDYRFGNFPLELNIKSIKEAQYQNKLKTPAEIEKFLDNNIDKIFLDTSFEKFKKGASLQWDYIKENPDKFTVNVIAVIAGSAAAVLLTTETGGIGILQAGLAYTAVHSGVKTIGYGVIGFFKGARNNPDGNSVGKRAYDGVISGIEEANNYSPNKPLSQYYTERGFEWGSNTALFGIFRGAENVLRIKPDATKLSFRELEESLKSNYSKATWKNNIGEKINNGSKIIGLESVKIGAETLFFTGFQTLSTPLQNEIIEQTKDSKDKKKFGEVMYNSLNELLRAENIGQAILYNLAFIATIKGSMYITEKGIKISGDKKIAELDRINKQYLLLGENIHKELSILEGKGYYLKGEGNNGSDKHFVLVDLEGNKINPKNPDIAKIKSISDKMVVLSKKYRKTYQTILDNNLHRENNTKQNIDKKPKNENVEKEKGNKNNNSEEKEKIEPYEQDSGKVGSGTTPSPFSEKDVRLTDFVKGINAKENIKDGIKISPRFEILMKEVYNIKEEGLLNTQIDNTVKLEIESLKDSINKAKLRNEPEIQLEINGKVRGVKLEEIEAVLGKLENNMKIDFKEAINQLLEVKGKTRQEIDGRFGNIKELKEIMKPFVEISEKLRKDKDNNTNNDIFIKK